MTSPHPQTDHADDQRRLREIVDREGQRMLEAERERRTVLGYTVMLGTLAGLFIVPVVAGAYLGLWLDGRAAGYSSRWTVSLILIGVGTGAYNVYRYVKEHW